MPCSGISCPASWRVLAAAANLPGGDGLHLGPAATKSAFLRVLDSPPPVLHLATHAAYDPEAPERSRVLFSPGSPDGPSDFLFLAEVVGLPLEGLSLAVLSACETAAGAGSDGGADSFGRAFLGSGAAATIASLWRQDDEASAIFWSSFYREAGRGVPPSESLRRAKLDFHRSGNALAHPYYWAGFLLFGKGDTPLPLPWSWAAVATVLLTPLSLLLLAAAYRGWSRSPAR